MSRLLVVYYSLSNGNTEKISKRLANKYDAESLVRIDTVTQYTGTHEEMAARTRHEISSGYLPEIRLLDGYYGTDSAEAANPENYDIIAIGSPVWWYSIAPAVRTFLTRSCWNEKTVVPFVTHGGCSGNAINEIKILCPGAVIRNPMEIRFDSAGGAVQVTPDAEVDRWIRNFNSI